MPSEKENKSESGSLEQALAELAALVQPNAERDNYFNLHFYEFVPYLLLLWAAFHVYQLDPFADTGGEGGGNQGTGDGVLIPLTGGHAIIDYGYCLSTSAGEDYGTYCTGKLIASAQKMIEILAARGITQVGFIGHIVAQRAAWIACLDHQIEVMNFYPTDMDWQLRERVQKLRADAQKKSAEASHRPT